MTPAELQELIELEELEELESRYANAPTEIPEEPRGLTFPPAEIIPKYQEEVASAAESLRAPGVLPKVVGAISLATAPIRGVSRALIADPVTRLTGSPVAGDIAGFGAEMAIPGLGLTKLPTHGLPKPTTITPRVATRARVTAEGPTPPIGRVEPDVPPIPGVSPTRTKPLPISPESLAIGGEIGVAYHRALNPEVFNRVATAGIEFFKNNPNKYDRTLSVTENIGRNIGKGGIDTKFLKEFGLEGQDAGYVINTYETMRQSAQTMANMSKVSKELNLQISKLSPQARETLKAAGLDVEDAAQLSPWWRRLDNVTRGAIVSQLSTAVRNAETVVTRLGMDTLTGALDNVLARLSGKSPKVGALDGLETFMNTIAAVSPKKFKAQKKFVEDIGKAFPLPMKRLLSSYHSDIQMLGEAGEAVGIGEKALRGAEKLTEMANIFNRGQEFLIRRAVFQSKLSQEVKHTTGLDINEIIKSGQSFKIPEEAVNKAIDRALEVTFGAKPKHGTVSEAFTNFITKTAPLGTLGIPFPRFLTQSLKFTYEHSPLSVMTMFSKAEKAKIASGDLSSVSKAIVGTSLLGAAFKMRMSPDAGAEWYNYNVGGKPVDMRPYAPFSAYLASAEIILRALGKRPGVPPMTSKEIASAVLGANIRAGTGLALIDTIIDGLADPEKQEDVPTFGKKLAGEYVGRLSTPLAQVRDFYDEFLTEEGVSIVRERSPEGSEFIGPTMANIPGISRMLPEVPSPTQAGPMIMEYPFLGKQLFGIRRTPAPNPGKAELEKFGFKYNEILPKTGVKSVDNKRIKFLGPLVEEELSGYVQRKEYRDLSDVRKPLALSREMKRLRRFIKAEVPMTETELEQVREKKKSLRLRRAETAERG